jgi:hypothetical protein
MKSNQTKDFLLGWLGGLFLCLVLNLIFSPFFALPFFALTLCVMYIIAIVSFRETRRYVASGLLFALLLGVFPMIVFWERFQIVFWYFWKFVDWLVNSFTNILLH